MKQNKIKHMLAVTKDKAYDKARSICAPMRRRSLKDTDFSIISNNCWGGKVYQRYGLPYTSPTVGIYFFADEYIRFLKDLKYYLSLPMTIIPPEESKYFEILKKREHLMCPIGKLDNVEIVFRHYHSPEEAIEKWERRKARINWDHLIVKFSYMNCCSADHVSAFEELDFKTKFVFVNTDAKMPTQICLNKYKKQNDVADDTTHYADHININRLICDGVVVAEKTPFIK